MTFAEYWEKSPYSTIPQEVAELAWNAAVEESAKIAYSYGTASGLPGSTARMIGHQVRAGVTKLLTQHATAQEDE